MRKGEIAKQHYEYEKLGSCALLAAVEPLTGQRLGQVHERRTKREFTEFCLSLAAAYPQASKIRLVLDNLNTHNASSFEVGLPEARERRPQAVERSCDLAAPPVGNQAGTPVRRTQQIAQALGARRRLLRRKQIGAKFREEQTVGTVAPLDDRDECGEEGAHQAAVEVLIKGAQNGREEGGRVLIETVGRKRRSLRCAGRCGSMT
jgi:DDE superfamily endonuclease